MALSSDVNHARSAIVELRSEGDSEEAGEFTDFLFRMLRRYCEQRGWKKTILQQHETSRGGLDRIVLEVAGHGAYGQLKHEAGQHRGIWVPMLYTHRSAVKVTSSMVVMPVVMPEEITLHDSDMQVEIYCGRRICEDRGRTTAVRLWHKPSSIVVMCEAAEAVEDTVRLLIKAKMLLQARLRFQPRVEANTQPIRFYDVPNGKVKDHRTQVVAALNAVLDGDLQPFITARITADERRILGECTEP